MQFRRSLPLTLVFALVASACSDSSGPQVELTSTETAALFTAIQEVFSGVVGLSVTDPSLSLSLMGAAEDVNETVSCPQGGNTTVTGTATDGTTSTSFDVDAKFNACKSKDFTINGTLGWAGTFSETTTTISIDLDMNGDLSVDTPSGKSGTCTIDVTYAFDIGGTSASGSVSGKICGQSFSQSF